MLATISEDHAIGRTLMITRGSGAALAVTLAAGLVSSPVQAADTAPAAAPRKLSVTPYAWATMAVAVDPDQNINVSTSLIWGDRQRQHEREIDGGDEGSSATRATLGSPGFDASARNRRFLEYIVEETVAGRAARLKGLTIATTKDGRRHKR
jgi:hypothetical protein